MAQEVYSVIMHSIFITDIYVPLNTSFHPHLSRYDIFSNIQRDDLLLRCIVQSNRDHYCGEIYNSRYFFILQMWRRRMTFHPIAHRKYICRTKSTLQYYHIHLSFMVIQIISITLQFHSSAFAHRLPTVVGQI